MRHSGGLVEVVPRRTTRSAFVWIGVGWLIASAQVGAQDLPAPTIAEVTSRIAQIQVAEGVPQADRESALRDYREALVHLGVAAEWTERAKEDVAVAEQAPRRLAAAQALLSRPLEHEPPTVSRDATLAEIERLQAEAEAQLRVAQDEVQASSVDPVRQARERKQLAERIAQLGALLIELQDSLETTTGDGSEPQAARRALLLARRAAVSEELAALQLQAGANFDLLDRLRQALNALAQRRVQLAERRLADYQRLAADRRRLEAERATQEARRMTREVTRRIPELRELARTNEELARERSQVLTAEVEAARKELSKAQAQRAELIGRFRSAYRREQAAGLTNAMGLLLRRERAILRDPSDLAAETLQRASTVQLRLVVLEEEREAANKLEGALDEVVLRAGTGRSAIEQAELEVVAGKLVADRRNLIDVLSADYTRHFNTLIELNATYRDQARITAAYQTYLEERILWVPSVSGKQRNPSLSAAAQSLRRLLSRTVWQESLRVLSVNAAARWPWLLAHALLLALLLGSRRWLRARLAASGELLRDGAHDSFLHTLWALLYTALLAAPLALVPFVLGGWLAATPQLPEASVACAAGLIGVAPLVYLLLLFRWLLASRGVLVVHMRWPLRRLKLLRRYTTRFFAFKIPAAFLVIASEAEVADDRDQSLGRLAFAVGALALAVFCQRVLRPKGEVISSFLERARGSWLHRLRYLWSTAAVVTPLLLCVLSLRGYHYTALHLERRLNASLLLALCLLLAHGLLSRWLRVLRRRVQAGQRVEEDTSEWSMLDLSAMSAEAKQLFRSALTGAMILGLIAIWSGVFPALKRLRQIEVWPSPGLIETETREPIAALGLEVGEAAEPERPAAEAPQTAPEDRDLAPQVELLQRAQPDRASPTSEAGEVVTLADLALALVALLVMLVAARNLPPLLEIVLLDRLPLATGSRHAISTVVRYVILIVGTTLGLGLIGVGWSKVQWLAAALTFGLAFGLQEIFANFVSGLIILFERPVRIGDTVTIGETTGIVTRVRIRATTIMDRDLKELIIPNKALVTGEVINWSLSDSAIRLHLPVGVAYGTDVAATKQLLLDVAKKYPGVLREPAPASLFLGFGDSSLDLELQVFIPNPNLRHQVQDELNVALEVALREAGVEIPFPQRDVNLRQPAPAPEGRP